MRSKTKTLGGRLEVAQSKAQGALDVFEVAAQKLEAAAEELKTVEADAENERLRLQNLAWSAGANATNYKAKASKIRELFQ